MTNYERVVKRFIPAFRASAAKMMVNEYGMKQQQAASILGTTQAAVSKYLSVKASKYSEVKIDSSLVKEYIEHMKKGHQNGGQKSMCSMCQSNVKFNCAFMVK